VGLHFYVKAERQVGRGGVNVLSDFDASLGTCEKIRVCHAERSEASLQFLAGT
jgi:hypothetical protein